jgi:hypothetical protein
MNMCEAFALNLGDKRTGCCIMTTHHTTLSPQMKIKLQFRHFYTTEVIEAELQAMPNTLPEHDFQVAFKKWQKPWEQGIHAEEDHFEGDGGQYA